MSPDITEANPENLRKLQHPDYTAMRSNGKSRRRRQNKSARAARRRVRARR